MGQAVPILPSTGSENQEARFGFQLPLGPQSPPFLAAPAHSASIHPPLPPGFYNTAFPKVCPPSSLPHRVSGEAEVEGPGQGRGAVRVGLPGAGVGCVGPFLPPAHSVGPESCVPGGSDCIYTAQSGGCCRVPGCPSPGCQSLLPAGGWCAGGPWSSLGVLPLVWWPSVGGGHPASLLGQAVAIGEGSMGTAAEVGAGGPAGGTESWGFVQGMGEPWAEGMGRRETGLSN